MGISPVAAVPKILAQTGLNQEDVDVFEVPLNLLRIWNLGSCHDQINEAFASQFAYCVEQLNVPMDKVNPKYVVRW